MVGYLKANKRFNWPITVYRLYSRQCKTIHVHMVYCPFNLFRELCPLLNNTLFLLLQRYYGESLPFGPDQSFQDDKIGYLTIEQALADYAVLLTELKTLFQATESKVVAFGGR